jgi:hypothetical protein
MYWDLNLISAKIFAPIIIVFGFTGNLLGLIIISKKALNKMGPHSVFICMFAMDFIYFPLIFHPYLAYAFDINVTAMSNEACKLYWYARYSMAIISPMMNVYISVERWISITFPSKRLVLLKRNVQIIYICVVIVVNLAFATQVAIGFELQNVVIETPIVNSSEHTERIVYYCDFKSLYWQDVAGFIDISIRVIVPVGLMVVFSVLLCVSIYKSRNRISSSHTGNATLRKDVRFSLVCMSLNVFYIVFSLPVSVVVLLQDYSGNQYYIPFSYWFFGDYSAGFYLMIGFNKRFRRVFLDMFYVKFKPSSVTHGDNNLRNTT